MNRKVVLISAAVLLALLTSVTTQAQYFSGSEAVKVNTTWIPIFTQETIQFDGDSTYYEVLVYNSPFDRNFYVSRITPVPGSSADSWSLMDRFSYIQSDESGNLLILGFSGEISCLADGIPEVLIPAESLGSLFENERALYFDIYGDTWLIETERNIYLVEFSPDGSVDSSCRIYKGTVVPCYPLLIDNTTLLLYENGAFHTKTIDCGIGLDMWLVPQLSERAVNYTRRGWSRGLLSGQRGPMYVGNGWIYILVAEQTENGYSTYNRVIGCRESEVFCDSVEFVPVLDVDIDSLCRIGEEIYAIETLSGDNVARANIYRLAEGEATLVTEIFD